MSNRCVQDHCQETINRVTWGRAVLMVMLPDSGLEEVHREALMASIEHLSDALEQLEALYKDLPREPAEPEPAKKPRLVPIRKTAPADAEPSHEQ